MTPHAVTPEPVMQTLSTFWVTGAVKAALDLDLFTQVGAGHRQPAALAAAIGAPARSTRMLADALTAPGLLSKDGDGYGLTEVAQAFLDRRQPSYFGGVANIVASPML